MYQLRELERGDLTVITKWRNSSELIRQLGAPFRYINPEVDIRWFDSYMANRNSCVRCAVVDVGEPDKILGLVSLTNIDQLNQSALLHIMIGDTISQGKGMGTFAVKSMVEHAFYNLNLHRIELIVLSSNKRAQHVYEKVGFVREGVLRKSIYKSGEFVDAYQYSLLREEYLSE
jgi:RimJ/RimL family protein N-acetyltransferase